jgi:hypothetical protein
MTLLTSGYWPTMYWSSRYWQEDYWPEYGVFVPPVVPPVTPKIGVPSRRRQRRKQQAPVELFTAIREWLDSLVISEEL